MSGKIIARIRERNRRAQAWREFVAAIDESAARWKRHREMLDRLYPLQPAPGSIVRIDAPKPWWRFWG